jgi:hypothetical protein
MKMHCRGLLIAILTSVSSVADSEGARLPTFGLYISDKSGSGILDTIAPDLARLHFVEVPPRALSNEGLPIAIFKNNDDDELEAVLGKGCLLLEFNGTTALPRADASAVIARFRAVHDAIEQHLAQLPEPHPHIQVALPIPDGCPHEF